MRTKLLAAATVIILICSYAIFNWHRFEITNKTQHELKDIKVSYGNVRTQRKSLKPGETFSFRPFITSDGGVAVSYLEDDKEAEHALGYATPHISQKCVFQITRAGVLGDCE